MSHHKQQFDDYGPEEDDLDHDDAYGAEGDDGDDGSDAINEEEIIGVILQLGNEILKNLNVEETINDVGFFFSDAFYIQFFQAAFPEIDYFSQMTEGQTDEEMAQNIQVLIQILGEKILNHDLSHIKGEEIVIGNPEHCINLLQLVQEISGMIHNKEGSQDLMQMDDDEDEEEDPDQQYSQRLEQEPNQKSANKSNSLMKQKLHQDSSELEEDDEAHIIHEKRKPQNQQQNVSNQKSSQQKQQQRGLSYSDEKSDHKQQQFLDMDEFEISNDFHKQLQGEDDGEMAAPHCDQLHGMEDEDEDEMNDEEYEDFLVQGKQPQKFNQQMNRSHGHQQMIDQMDDNDDEDEEEMLQQMQGMDPNGGMGHVESNDPYGEENDQNDDNDEMIDIDDIDFENIDYDQLDPQILQIAEENGVHPKEILKQLLMQQREGEDEDQDDDEDQDEEADMIEKQMQEEQLRREKEAFKAQMGLSSDKKKPAPQQEPKSQQKAQVQQNQQYSNQKQNQIQMNNHQFDYGDEEEDENEEYEQEDSYYSENEIKSRIKLLSQKSHSAPYLIINDCYEEPLYDDDDESNIIQRAYSTSMLQSLEAMQAQQANQQQNGFEDDGEEMDEETAQLLYQQQQKMMQQQQNQQQVKQNKPGQNSKITEVSKSKESSSYVQQQNQMKQQLMNHGDDDEEDDEMDIDISQKLKDLKNNQQQDHDEMEEGGEGEDDEEMLVDLDQLDDHNRQMLLEYLQQEYAKNPDQFPFPKELIEEYMMKQQKQNIDQESVKDIKSEEMIVEEANANQESQQEDQQNDEEHGGEDEGLTAEQQEHLQQLLMMQQQQQQMEQNAANYENQMNQMNMQYQEQYGMPLKKKKKRPQSGVKSKKTKSNIQKQIIPQVQLYQSLEEIPQEILQLAVQLLQEQQIDMENIDPNVLQQLILAQAQQIQQISAQQQQAVEKSTIRSTKRGKSPASKKRGISANTKTKQMAKPIHQQMKYLMPSTPGNHIKSFTNQKNVPARGMSNNKKKPAKKKGTGKKTKTVGHMQQQMVHIPQMQNLEDYNQQEQMMLPQQQQAQILDIPNLSEEFLNQLSEEELEQLLQHQQQLMMQQQMQVNQQQVMLNQPQSKKSVRPKSGKPKASKGPKIPPTYSSYSNPYGKSKKGTKGKKKKGTKKSMNPQGVVLNNYFPALENEVNEYVGQMDEQTNMNPRDARYPKFGTDIINNPQMLGLQQDPIDEVPSEQEEGESQEIIQQNKPNFYHPDNQEDGNDDQEGDEDEEAQLEGEENNDDQDVLIAQDQDQNGEDQDAQPDDQMDVQQQQQYMPQLTDQQLLELIQNAHQLTPDQQAQLQIILQQRMQLDNTAMVQERAQSYQNIYQILMENVRRAQERLAPLGHVSTNRLKIEDADMRILKQKEEFETMLKLYHNDLKNRQQRKYLEDAKLEKKLQREQKIQAIKEKKFQEELMLKQKSLNYKRNAQQVKLCQKVYKLASELEKNKLLAEKKEYKENLERKKVQNKLMVDAIETHYKNQIQMLKEKIENERFERKIAQQAQQQALARMKRELRDQKKKEVDKYLQRLKQEDQRYDFESINANKLENELMKMYRHGAVR